MMFEDEVTSDYFVNKGIMMLLFSLEIEKAFASIADLLYFDYDNFLVYLKDIVINNCNNLDSKSIDNLDKILAYFRYDYCDKHPEQREKIYNKVNEIISYRNRANLTGVKEFVEEEFLCRFKYQELATGSVSSNDKIMENYLLVKEYMEFDFYILYAHSTLCSVLTFLYIEPLFLQDDNRYIAGINKLIEECPSLLKDSVFRYRVKSILKKHNDGLKSADSKNDKIMKMLQSIYDDCYNKILDYDNAVKKL